MVPLSLAVLIYVADISGMGYTAVVHESYSKQESYEISESMDNCDTFKEQGYEFYRVICKSNEVITNEVTKVN